MSALHQWKKKKFYKRWKKIFGDLRCIYCDKPCRRGGPETAHNKATIDHLTPMYLGGNSKKDNLVLSCYQCNQDKGTKQYWEFVKI